MPQTVLTGLNWLFRQFGKASMLARLSMLFNVALGWSVFKIHQNEDVLRKAVIDCHEMRYNDFKSVVEEQGYIKKEQSQIKDKVLANAEKITTVEQKAEEIAKEKAIFEAGQKN